jgi:hypothetical protein
VPPILSFERRVEATCRLLTSPDDLIQCGVRLAGSSIRQTGTTEHRQLFKQYLLHLTDRVNVVASEWLESVEGLTTKLGDAESAREQLILEYPAGPATDMRFIGIVRTYWLACDALNGQLQKEQWLDPPRFLLQWVEEVQGGDLCVEVLASQPYWPIGLDEHGNWC